MFVYIFSLTRPVESLRSILCTIHMWHVATMHAICVKVTIPLRLHNCVTDDALQHAVGHGSRHSRINTLNEVQRH
jgi:hypothetical protein